MAKKQNDQTLNDVANQDADDQRNEEQEEQKTLTQDEVNRLISQAKSKAKDEVRKEFEEKFQQEVEKQVEQRRSMTEDQEKEFEMSQLKRKAEKAEQELKELKLSQQASVLLSQKGIKVTDDVLSIVLGEDWTQTEQRIEEFSNLVETNVNERVKQQTRQKPPQNGSTSPDDSDDFDFVKYANEKRLV